MHLGNGAGLTSRRWGQKSGQEDHTLATSEMPSHSHGQAVTAEVGNQASPVGAVPATANDGESNYSNSGTTTLNGATNAGNSQPFNNMPPFLVINFSIALQGIFPSRS